MSTARGTAQHILLVGTNKPGLVPLLRRGAVRRVTVLTEPWYADRFRTEGADAVLVVPDVADLTAALHAVVPAMADDPVTRVVAPSERGVPTGAWLRSYLDLPGTLYDVAVGFTAKHAMKRRLVTAGVPVAPHRVVRTRAEARDAVGVLGRPAILKPALGTGATGSVVVRATDDVDALAAPLWERGRAHPAVLVERYLGVEREYHLDGVVVDGVTLALSVCAYLRPTLLRRHDEFVGSAPLPTDDPRRGELAGLHDAAVRALGLRTGVTHLEVLEHDGGDVVGEVACRPGGGAIVPFLAHVHGVDLWRVFLDLETTGATDHLGPLDPDRPVAWYGLPVTAGVVRSTTPVEALRAVPGVTYAQVDLAPGDRVEDRFHSSSQAGWVAMAGATSEALHATMAAVRATWRLDTAPAEEVASR